MSLSPNICSKWSSEEGRTFSKIIGKIEVADNWAYTESYVAETQSDRMIILGINLKLLVIDMLKLKFFEQFFRLL